MPGRRAGMRSELRSALGWWIMMQPNGQGFVCGVPGGLRAGASKGISDVPKLPTRGRPLYHKFLTKGTHDPLWRSIVLQPQPACCLATGSGAKGGWNRAIRKLKHRSAPAVAAWLVC